MAIKISLTQFVDFVLKSGTTRLTHVSEVKAGHAAGYSPATDYYKQLREEIVDMHTNGKPKTVLDNLPLTVSANRQQNYMDMATAYKRFLGRKTITWFTPPRAQWTFGNLEVGMNPELGLDINGVKHIIKLYMKSDALTQRQANVLFYMSQQAFPRHSSTHAMSILDVRNAKLFTAPATSQNLAPLLQGEALAFAQIYQSI